MKNVLRSIGMSLFILGLLLMAPLEKASAALQYQALNKRVDVACDKVWNIKLNMDVNPATINDRNIEVLDDNGKPVTLKLGYISGSECITAAPVGKYEQGKTYTLIIQNVESKSGLPLKTPVKMQFTTTMVPGTTLGTVELPLSVARLTDTHTYEITDVITVKGPAGAGYSLTYDVGTSSSSPYQKDLDLKVQGLGASIITTALGTKQMTAEGTVSSSGITEYKVVRTIQNSGISYNSDISNTTGDYSSFKDYTKYTSPEEKIQSNDASIKTKAQQLFSGMTNPYFKAKKAFEFVNSHITYDTANGNKDALSALQTGKGVCEDYAELFTALLRASGVPARIATGFWIESQGFTGSTADGNNYRHAWPEFYLPEYGWIIVEPTFEYTVNGIKQIDYSHFSNLDSSDHFIEGYNIDGEYTDTELFWSSRGDITMDEHSYVKRLN